jgi:hypothetical protein
MRAGPLGLTPTSAVPRDDRIGSPGGQIVDDRLGDIPFAPRGAARLSAWDSAPKLPHAPCIGIDSVPPAAASALLPAIGATARRTV